jgi:uncharacterized GH25 family protein
MNKLVSTILFVLFFTIFNAHSQVIGTRSIITDPALSYRCKALLKQRKEKIKTKQKLKSMLQRNNKLLKQTPQNKKTLITKLSISKNEITNYLSLTKLKIKSMEENIIRKGCPGIKL